MTYIGKYIHTQMHDHASVPVGTDEMHVTDKSHGRLMCVNRG